MSVPSDFDLVAPNGSALREVVSALDAASDLSTKVMADALRRPIGIEDVAPWIRFDADNYVRSLVAKTERWELRLLCWRPSQSTALHAHDGSSCAVRVVRGSAIEARVGARDQVLGPGAVIEEASSRFVHQVGNAGPDALLTLHAYSPPLRVDAPTGRAGRNVVIVGGGASGVAVAIHLLGRGDRNLRVYIVERGPWLGRGVAYGVDSPIFRLNVPASKMSLDPAQPDDFVAWAGAESTPDAFLSRAAYGDYVAQRFEDAVTKSLAKARMLRGEVVGIDDGRVLLSDGTALPAEVVVLATGIAPRVAPSALPRDARVMDAWDECALAALPKRGRLLVLGAGLSALDVLAVLHARGFEGNLTVLSRRGLLPRPHLSVKHAPVPLAPEIAASAPRTLPSLVRWVRWIIRDYEARGLPWQVAIDALRPHIPAIYRDLPNDDRARFVRSVRPYWDVFRHRAPEGTLDLVESLRKTGRLEVLAGRVDSCAETPDALAVRVALANGDHLRRDYDRIIRCIGPALESSEAGTPLIRTLLETGAASPCGAGLGIKTDPEGRVVDASGAPSSRLFAIGAVRRASSWETTAMPDISVHARALAERIVAG